MTGSPCGRKTKSLSTATQNRVSPYNVFTLENYTRNEDGTYDFTISRLGDEENPVLNSSSSHTGNRQIYIQAMLEYARTFWKHDINAMVLYYQDGYMNSNPGNNLMNALPKRRQGFLHVR